MAVVELCYRDREDEGDNIVKGGDTALLAIAIMVDEKEQFAEEEEHPTHCTTSSHTNTHWFVIVIHPCIGVVIVAPSLGSNIRCQGGH